MLERGSRCLCGLIFSALFVGLGACAGEEMSYNPEPSVADAAPLAEGAATEGGGVGASELGGELRSLDATGEGGALTSLLGHGAEAALGTVQRYPSLEAPPAVRGGQEFDVRFALTLFPEVVGVDLLDGAFTELGEVILDLGAGDSWDLEVVLVAPGFESLDEEPGQKLRLPRELDSDRITFRLRAPTVDRSRDMRILATLWHEGSYQGKVARTVRVLEPGGAPGGDPDPGLATATAAPPPTRLALATANRGAPDLTVQLFRIPDNDTRYIISVNGPGRTPRKGVFDLPEAARAELVDRYRQMGGASTRALRAPTGGAVDERVALARELGAFVWQELAPTEFKEAYWEVSAALGDDFDTLHIYTEEPLLPWELMIPVSRNHRSAPRSFLGTELLIARWPLDMANGFNELPPLVLPVREVVAVAPRYEGASELSWQGKELAAMEALPGFRRLDGKIESFRELVRSPPAGIIHFAGHGQSDHEGDSGSRYSIQLEDGHSVSLRAWKGYNLAAYDSHPLYFFNACEVGQAENVAGFVNGWAPTVLDHGASGFIGALWPVGDHGASQFAVAFYEGLSSQLESGSTANVGFAVRDARRLFYRTGDPTFLAYVYYGHPRLSLKLVPTQQGPAPGSR